MTIAAPPAAAPNRVAPAAGSHTDASPHVTILTHRAELDTIIPVWREFRRAHGLDAPNSDPDRYLAVLDALGSSHEPHVVLFGEPARPCGMLIARTSRQRLRFRLGYLPLYAPRLRALDIVHGGLITDGSNAARAAVVEYLRTVCCEHAFEHVTIHYLPCADPLYRQLTDRRMLPDSVLDGAPLLHWHFQLADGPIENTLARFSRKHRYNLRRADRILNEHVGGELTLQRVDAATDVDDFITAAASITAESYHAHLPAGIRATDAERRRLTEAAAAGQLRCYLLRTDDETLAYQAGLLIDGTYHLLATGYRPAYARFSPGQVLLVRVFGDLAADSIRRVDYGFGDARYKQIYGTASRDEATILVFGRTWRARVARGLHVGSLAVTGLARRLGFVQRIKRAWRARLASG